MLIVTIAREYGSGGRLIGEKLAKDMGISFYDKKLIELAAKQSGFSPEVIKSNDSTKSSFFSYMGLSGSSDLPLSEQVFIVQSDIIKKAAESESCVIIGRCADFLLKDFKNCVKVFVHAPFDYRVAFAEANYGEIGDVAGAVRRTDRQRKSYYNYYTEQEWGMGPNYDLGFDSSIGVEASCRLIEDYIGFLGLKP